MGITQQVVFSPNMYVSLQHHSSTVRVCILSHKMYSLPQDVKDLLHYFKSVHFLPSCNISLHFVLLNSTAISYNKLTIGQKFSNNLPKSLTDRPVLLSCLVFTSVAAIGHLQRRKEVFSNMRGLSLKDGPARSFVTSSWVGVNIRIPDNI